jgi:hypothetical protein
LIENLPSGALARLDRSQKNDRAENRLNAVVTSNTLTLDGL